MHPKNERGIQLQIHLLYLSDALTVIGLQARYPWIAMRDNARVPMGTGHWKAR